ncbi:SMI1/KNR4 family protein [Flavobacterium sp. AC]|uniref:SMI1/KNR4 family protein n=1 Tax=Flavobacterium azizsancarii TaxID=2961580 RepID=A0ABT4W7G4_9FLAO|nr:SMI1/KNR4 family protein [Flavobacterium azizsancarii]MDA6068426.1 SMI1/KNR4 family protein [Flavobacterium azizsancarii]
MAHTIRQSKENLFSETDGSKFDKIKDKLIKNFSVDNREEVIDIFIEYSKTGRMQHWRNFLLTDIIDLVKENETCYSDFFQWTITKPELIYWGIDGLLKTQGQKAYHVLIHLVQNETLEVEVRAKAIKSISIYSNNRFDRNLPKDPGYWKIEELRIEEIIHWQNQGYNKGDGHKAPNTNPNLKNPKTELEKAVAKLNDLLEKERKNNQDLSNPSNWLSIADENKIIEIEKKWSLPENYLIFLKNFSPINVFIDDDEKFFQGLSLYGADDLIKNQNGYSFNPVTGETLQQWPSNYIVIADAGAAPYCINIKNIKNNDAPIYTSFHGAGEWEFEEYAKSFVDFLKDIVE